MVNKINVGDKAPNFRLPDAENRTRSLKEFLGQEVILVFFVRAFITTCTKEVCEFRDSTNKMVNMKAQIVGVDINGPPKIKVFANKNKLTFPILSDHEHEVLELYGVEKPSILILNEKGIVCNKWIYDGETVTPNYDEIEESLEKIVAKKKTEKCVRNVITISRQIGSRGDEIARNICKILRYSYFDKELLYRAAKSIGVCEGQITDFSEDSYKIAGIVDKILGRKRIVATTHMLKNNSPIQKTLDEEICLDVIRTVINNLAGRGKIVILGRGGQGILKNKTNTLHVRIVAPIEFRVEQVMKEEGVNKDEALKIIDEKDKATSEYLQRFYNINWDDPTNYNIIINTEKIDVDTASRVIVTACSLGHRYRPKSELQKRLKSKYKHKN